MIILKDVVKARRSITLGPLSVSFPNGTLTLVTGENSGGKSSLLKLLTGSIEPDSGEIHVSDEASIAYIPDTLPFPENMTPRSLEDACISFYPKWDAQSYKNILKSYTIPYDGTFRTFSKGFQKLLMFAVAEASQPDIVVMDEPTNGLDQANLLRLMSFIERMIQRGCCVIIASNDIPPYEAIADTCLMINKGALELNESVDTLLLKYRLWKGTLEDYKKLDKSNVLSAYDKRNHIECLVESSIGEITDLETILIGLRKGIRI